MDYAEKFVEFLKEINMTEEELQKKLNDGWHVGFVQHRFKQFIENGSVEKCIGDLIFESESVEYLRKAVLSAPPDIDYDEYWERSGATAGKILAQHLGVDSSSRVLDFGCGLGRIAKALIAETGCHLVGVDISASMRENAERMVASPLFSTMAAEEFVGGGCPEGSISAAYCSLVLQHCADPERELKAIYRALAPGAPLAVINSRRRFVPTVGGWIDDGFDVRAAVLREFTFDHEVDLSAFPNLFFRPADAQSEDEKNHYCLIVRKGV